MKFNEFEQLKEKIDALIQFNHSLMEEKKAYAERLLFRERQIRQLKERCARYERNQKEAYQRLNAILSKLDGIKP